MTLRTLNGLDRPAFVSVLGGVFEHSPWVAERAWLKRPFQAVDELWRTMCAVVDAAAEAEQIALIRAHPDLGARANLSGHSASEQAAAGFDRLTEDEYGMLLHLNGEYRAKFNFPFIFAVKGSAQHDIFYALQMRLDSGADEELRQALFEIGRIAWFRLEDMLKGS